MKSICSQPRLAWFAFALLATSLPFAGACGGGSSADGGGMLGNPSGGAQSANGGAATAVGGASTSGGSVSAGAGGSPIPSAGTSANGGAGAGTGGAATTGMGGAAATGAGGTGAGGTGAGGGAATNGGAGAAGTGGSGSTAYDPCPPAPTNCKIMPFGDSITDGYLAQRGGYRIPLFQRAHLEGKHLTFVGSAMNGPDNVDGVPFPKQNEGHSAYTIDPEPLPAPAHKGISTFVKTSIPTYKPDIVLLMIGTNDVDNSIDLPNVPTRLGALVDSIIALDNHTLIVVAQITPTMQDPLNARIQTYNAAIPALVKSRADAGKHVALVDMYDAFVSDKAYKTTLLFDRLHPNIPGFQRMADTWNLVIHDLVH